MEITVELETKQLLWMVGITVYLLACYAYMVCEIRGVGQLGTPPADVPSWCIGLLFVFSPVGAPVMWMVYSAEILVSLVFLTAELPVVLATKLLTLLVSPLTLIGSIIRPKAKKEEDE